MDSILFALWFFLPGGMANVAPIIAARLPYLSRWNAAIDGGLHFRSKRLFGDHKTWRGLISGIYAAIVVVYVQQLIYQDNLALFDGHQMSYLFHSPLLIGVLFGLGALLGDAIESFFKRQININPGATWFPFDQVDYIIGGCLALAFIMRLSLAEYVSVLLTWFLMHLLFSYIGFVLKFKAKPI